ncbi:MAG: hypothetical protein ABEH83_06965 [Halobacterium sp.]
MPEDDQDGEHDEEFAVEDEDAAPSAERSPTDIGPDPSVAGDLPDEGDGEERPAAEDAPLSDLREDIERRREAETDDDFEELFTEMEVGDVDDEDVWEELSESAASPSVDVGAAAATREAEPDEAAERAGPAAGDRDVRVVEKRLCHGCPHFADPPQTACTHEGTTIEAEVDVDHFRVVDCPIVAQREAAETSDFSADES